MRLNRLIIWLGLVAFGLQPGCTTTSPQRQNPNVAPPLPTPAPIAPGQVMVPSQQPPPAVPGGVVSPPPGVNPSVTTPNPGNTNIPLPPGASMPPPGVPGGAAVAVVPASPEQGRVTAMSARLYQANPWLRLKPQWIVRPGDMPGMANQGEQYVLISEGLVRSASDGQLAAVMSLHLADMAAGRQRMIMDSERAQRMAQPRPPFFPGSNTLSSELAYLNQAEAAKFQSDARDMRRREHQDPPIDPPTYARQVLTQAGFSAQELDAAAPLLQRFPPVKPVCR